MKKTNPKSVPEITSKRKVFSPAIDIVESQDEILVWADLPGVSEDDVHVTFEKNVLTLEARVTPDARPSFQLAHREYHEGDFRRVFTVSDAIDSANISATLKDGVLRLALPKTEPAKPRTIEIGSG